MTDFSEEIGEEDLHGYVDGRLDETRRERVRRAMAANPALRQRIEDWRDHAEGLRRALLAEETPSAATLLAQLAATKRAPRRRYGMMAAALLLALGAGAAGGWLARGDSHLTEISRLGIEAASAYRVFAKDPAGAAELTSDSRAELVSWMAQKLGRRIALPDLSPLGYDLVGGRIVSAMYGPAALLIYRDASDNRVTIYVQPMKIGKPAEIQPLATATVDGYAWIARQVGYTVMSSGDREHLLSVADEIRAETQS